MPGGHSGGENEGIQNHFIGKGKKKITLLVGFTETEVVRIDIYSNNQPL